MREDEKKLRIRDCAVASELGVAASDNIEGAKGNRNRGRMRKRVVTEGTGKKAFNSRHRDRVDGTYRNQASAATSAGAGPSLALASAAASASGSSAMLSCPGAAATASFSSLPT